MYALDVRTNIVRLKKLMTTLMTIWLEMSTSSFAMNMFKRASKDPNNRWFGGSPVHLEPPPVTDFREACFRQYETGETKDYNYIVFGETKNTEDMLDLNLSVKEEVLFKEDVSYQFQGGSNRNEFQQGFLPTASANMERRKNANKVKGK
uniref:Uncharacterized protein n=1 Tax=Megaselia scalaris TaxID=36166 RepID=T1GSF1_MEGSC